mmetsp:Transcript_540/g.1257  ORF Transcript_540/g.1257 Transcript_540/m.1257 type:complete len:218 (-) Transcript_540:465-1118(-)
MAASDEAPLCEVLCLLLTCGAASILPEHGQREDPLHVLVDGAGGVHLVDGHARAAEVLDGPTALLVERAHARPRHLLVVVRPPGALAALHNAPHHLLVGALEEQHALARAKHGVEVARVLLGAREAIQEHKLAGRGHQKLFQEGQHHRGVHQLACLHHFAHLQAQRCLALHLLPQQVARGHVQRVGLLHNAGAHGAFATARASSNKNDAKGGQQLPP